MELAEIHFKAMAIADEADIRRCSGDKENACKLYEEAFIMEKNAAEIAVKEGVGEPSESILIKSAACLAYDAQLFRESEKMVGLALSRELTEDLAEEMRDLLENIHFARHLRVKGVSLSDNEIQISVAGRGVAHGMAREDDINDRIATFKKLTIRTAERASGVPFRKSGQPSKEVKSICESYLSVARAASFAVTMRLGQVGVNSLSPDFPIQANAIVDDIATNLGLVNEGDLGTLQGRIKDTSYFENFVHLAKEFAPDGDEVNVVGITYKKNGDDNPIQLTRKKCDYKEIINKSHELSLKRNESIEGGESTTKIILGTLSAADSTSEKVTLLDEKKKIIITVPDGLTDIVRKYFDETVTVVVRQEDDKKTLISIDMAS